LPAAGVNVSNYTLDPAEVAFFTSADIHDLTRFFTDQLGIGYSDTTIQDHYFDSSDSRKFRAGNSLRLRTYIEQPTKLDIINVSWNKQKRRQGHGFAIRNHEVNVQSLTGISTSRRHRIFNRFQSIGDLEVLKIKKQRRTFEMISPLFSETSRQASSIPEVLDLKEPCKSFNCVDNGLTILLDAILECSHGNFHNIVEIEFDIKSHRQQAMSIIQLLVTNFGPSLESKKYNKIEYALADKRQRLINSVPPQFSSGRAIGQIRGFSASDIKPSVNGKFLPGEHFNIASKWKRKAKPTSRMVVGRIPGRFHFFAWEPARFSRLAPGGGGLGTSISAIVNDIKISVDANKSLYCTPSVLHLKKLFCKLVDYDETKISIIVRRDISNVHNGLGSNVSSNTGVLAGLNFLFGSPYSTEDLYDILIHNYVENSKDHQFLVSGVDTGVGESSLLYGGIVWVDGQARYIGNITTPSMYGIIAFGIREKLTKEQNSKPHANAELLMSLIAKHKLRPHFKAGNLERLLSEAWNLNSLAFRIEKSSYNFEIYSKFSEIVKEKGGSYAGISSEGPVMFALANNRRVANAIAKAVATKLSKYFSSSRVGSVGNRLSISVRS
jgi:hypothetical protein